MSLGGPQLSGWLTLNVPSCSLLQPGVGPFLLVSMLEIKFNWAFSGSLQFWTTFPRTKRSAGSGDSFESLCKAHFYGQIVSINPFWCLKKEYFLFPRSNCSGHFYTLLMLHIPLVGFLYKHTCTSGWWKTTCWPDQFDVKQINNCQGRTSLWE